MKKIFFALLMLVGIGSAEAQKLYVSNTTCADVDIKLYAKDGSSGCGPIADEESNWMTITSNGGGLYDFGVFGPYGIGFPWATPTSGLLSTSFNFFRADVRSSCFPTTPIGTTDICYNWNAGVIPANLDGVAVYNGNTSCGTPSTDWFVLSGSCGVCHVATICQTTPCPPLGTIPCQLCAPDCSIKVSLYMVGADWYLDVYQ